MDVETEEMTAELAEELAANNTRRAVDTKTMPARFGNLKAVGQSPAHGFASFQSAFDPETLALRMGSGLHAVLFEDRPVIMWTGKVRNGKVWQAFKDQHSGKIILSAKEYARAQEIAAAVRRHPIAANLLFGPDTIREHTIMWEQLGRSRRSTPDVRGPYHVCELKSTRCAEPSKFNRDGAFRAYHVQLADQCLAIEAETGKRPEEAYIVAVESVRPYAVTVLQLTEQTLRKGEHLARLWLERLISCERSGLWPGYTEQIEVFDVPDDGFDLAFVDEIEEVQAWKERE
ncbi:MAG: PD-(D/E)XK nuclease-like domain-containing protein [Chloroflexi bacterium]|nr:PD-(D/E)XK nuclease-like domain-containing protein [Chloroflexota bacterium]